MALKKPSDFFGNNKTPLDEVKESYDSARPEKIEKVSEAFDAFKSNLNHIQSLSDFTSTFDSFKNNLEKVESVSGEVSEIREEIKTLIKKEDLDSAMMAQLLFVEESITNIESKISSINGKTVDSIKEDFANLSDTVNGFLSVDVPKYKKLIAESEVKTDSRFATFKEGIEENLDKIKVDVNKEVETALESIESINENTINIVKAEVKETVGDVNKKVNELVEKELPKYKKLFAETEVKTEEKINSAIHSYKSTIESLSERVKEFTEEEIPKYSNLLIETKLKSEKEVKKLEEEVLSRVKTLSEKVESLSEDVEQKTFERVESLQDVVKEYKEEIESISKRYETLQKDFTGRVVHEDKKLSQYSKKLDEFSKRFSFIEETLTEDVRELKENLETNTSKFYAELKSEIDNVEQNIAQTVKDLEVNIVINETHLKKQNEYIGNIQEEVKEVLDKLQLDVLEKKNAQLVERINHVEEVFSKINEKTLLTEDNPTLPGDPSTNNSGDPLTPLDQKFVTLDQLQNHYRIFINRIQQQIATIGGGGEVRLEFLDDVDRDSVKVDGKFLKYQASSGKFIGADASGDVGAGGTWATFDSNTGITTTKKVKIDNDLEVTGVTTSTGGFVGNVTGTATGLSGTPDISIRNITGVAATFTGVLTYEDVTNIDSIGLITARTGVNVLAGGINVSGVSTFAGDISIADKIIHTGDTNTAIRFPAADTFTIETAGSERLRIDSNGDVGVGIADPQERLHVARTVMVTGNTPQIRLNANDSDADDDDRSMLGQATGNGNFVTTAVDNDTILRGTATGSLLFGVGTAEKFRITSDGKFGFGTNSISDFVDILYGQDADNIVMVRGADNTTEYAAVGVNGGNAVITGGGVGGTSTGIVFRTAASGTEAERLRITSSGNVGINQSSPAYTLDLGESSSTIRLVSENFGTAIRVGAGGGSNDVTLIRVDGDSGNHDGESNSAQYGFSLKYLGSFSGNANAFAIFSDNQTGTQVQAFTVLQDGTIGINKTSPSESLDVGGTTKTEQLNVTGVSTFANTVSVAETIEHTGDTNTSISFPSNDYIRFTTSNSARLNVTSNGYVLLGTNSEPSGGDAHAQNARLLVQGRIGNTADSGRLNLQRGSSASNGSSIGSITFTDNSNNAYARIETLADATPGTDDYPGRIVFSTTPDGSASPTEKFRITSSGNIGIGEDSPSAILHVTKAGDPNIIQENSGNDSLDRNNTYSFQFSDGEGAFVKATRPSSGSASDTHLAFGSGGAERMRISSAGLVGVGTDSPESALHVIGSFPDSLTKAGVHMGTLTSGYAAMQFNNTAGGFIDFSEPGVDFAGRILYTHSDDSMIFYNAATERLRITTGGSLLLGATAVSNSEKLRIHTASSDKAIMKFTNTGTGSTAGDGLEFGLSSNEDAEIILREDKNILFLNGATTTEKVRIDSSGRLLIGTTTEGNELADNLTVADTGNCGITIRSGTSNYGSIYFSDATSGGGEYAGQIEYLHSADRFTFYAGVSAIMRLTSDKVDILGHTETDTLNVSGISTFQDDVHLGENDKLRIGDSQDLEIYHDSSNINRIEASQQLYLKGTNINLYKAGSSEKMASFIQDGAVELYNDNSKKFETTGAGVTVFGTTQTQILTVDGSSTFNGNINMFSTAPQFIMKEDGSSHGDTNWALVRDADSFSIRWNNAAPYALRASTSGGSVTSVFLRQSGLEVNASGTVIQGSLSKGSGSFKIDHPLVGMSTTHNLVHSFIEGPQADLIYRGKVDLVNGSATVNIDTAGRMTEGTFVALCTNVQCFTTNETDWTAIKGSVSGNTLTVLAQDSSCTATVSWMVVGERKDQHMIDTNWTDDNGRVITEPPKTD